MTNNSIFFNKLKLWGFLHVSCQLEKISINYFDVRDLKIQCDLSNDPLKTKNFDPLKNIFTLLLYHRFYLVLFIIIIRKERINWSEFLSHFFIHCCFFSMHII